MNYLVIDLEMCRVSKLYCKGYKYASEIIQIGTVLLDEEFSRIAALCQYVNPEYGVNQIKGSFCVKLKQKILKMKE